MWDKITLYKFQQIEKINERAIDDLDKLLFTTCIVFDMTEYELDNTPKRKAERLIEKVGKIFSSELKAAPQKKVGKYILNYDMNTMTWGQWNELAAWLPQPILNADKIMATMASKAEGHKQRADYFLMQPITKVVGSIQLISERFKSLFDEYKSLWGLDQEQHGPEVAKSQFTIIHGWQYSTEQIAQYERISMDQAYDLPCRQALNDLVYLKAKAKFEFEQANKK